MKNKVLGIIQNNKNQILLLYRKKEGREYYVFPGGGVENTDNSIESALKREIYEEVGVRVNMLKKLYTLTVLDHKKHIFFLCRYLSGKPRLVGEEKEKNSISDIYKPTWVKICDLQNYKIFPIESRDWFLKDLEKGVFKPRELEVTSIKNLKNE